MVPRTKRAMLLRTSTWIVYLLDSCVANPRFVRCHKVSLLNLIMPLIVTPLSNLRVVLVWRDSGVSTYSAVLTSSSSYSLKNWSRRSGTIKSIDIRSRREQPPAELNLKVAGIGFRGLMPSNPEKAFYTEWNFRGDELYRKVASHVRNMNELCLCASLVVVAYGGGCFVV